MNERIKKLFEKMNEDKAFAEKLLSQTEKEEAIKLARTEGIELTLEDIDEANEIIRKVIEKQKEGELSEEELEQVAGGMFGVEIIVLASLSAAGSMAASAVVSATASVVSGAAASLVSLSVAGISAIAEE